MCPIRLRALLLAGVLASALGALSACGASSDDVVSADQPLSVGESTSVPETTTVSSQPTLEDVAALDYELTVCLIPGASEADYRALEEILNRPTGVGTEVELPAGVEGVSFASGPDRVIVYLEPTATTTELDALAADLLSAPKVVGLIAGHECAR